MQNRVKFIKKEKIAKDTYSFFFEKTPSLPSFFPGQYLNLLLPIVPTDGKGSSHFFTICSSPTEKKLMITTKTGDSEFKTAMFMLQPGTYIDVVMPIGGFYLREEDKTPRVLIAGGIGITVFRSIIIYAVIKKLDIQMTLIVSFSSKEDFVFYEQLKTITKSHKNIRIIYNIGRLSEANIREYIQDISIPVYMIAGLPEMVDDTIDLLQAMNVPLDHIQEEHFTGY